MSPPDLAERKSAFHANPPYNKKVYFFRSTSRILLLPFAVKYFQVISGTIISTQSSATRCLGDEGKDHWVIPSGRAGVGNRARNYNCSF
jgi:hypothetical protein